MGTDEVWEFTGGSLDGAKFYPESLIPVWLREEDITDLLAGEVSNASKMRLRQALEDAQR